MVLRFEPLAVLAAAFVVAVSAPAAAAAAAKTSVKPAARTFVAEVWADKWFAL